MAAQRYRIAGTENLLTPCKASGYSRRQLMRLAGSHDEAAHHFDRGYTPLGALQLGERAELGAGQAHVDARRVNLARGQGRSAGSLPGGHLGTLHHSNGREQQKVNLGVDFCHTRGIACGQTCASVQKSCDNCALSDVKTESSAQLDALCLRVFLSLARGLLTPARAFHRARRLGRVLVRLFRPAPRGDEVQGASRFERLEELGDKAVSLVIVRAARRPAPARQDDRLEERKGGAPPEPGPPAPGAPRGHLRAQERADFIKQVLTQRVGHGALSVAAT